MCKISFLNPSLEGSVGHIFFCLFGAPFPRSTLEPGRLSRRDALRMSAGRQRGTWAPGEFWAPGELGRLGHSGLEDTLVTLDREGEISS